ncbi:hypothetical protein DB32_003707 [Sandaracinus amylolyticus]|uniref:Lipid/polyisoprenoid-binding YceI-like domain-containing protein n=1 Tax=Sandaracinus amylolyticus TaxID=927083 RepID=A0A0F6W3R4_9BACT|nr:hypothetical protein DB32_003707 [Sandaracinus amylolyticus]
MLSIALSVLAVLACAGTSGRAVVFPVVARASAPATFTTSTGWDVVLDEASVTLRALRVLAADDDALSQLLSSPVARAHGGHALERGVRAELLGPIELDALAPEPTEIGIAHGSAGPARAIDLELGESDVVARVRGVATRGDEQVVIAGELVVPGGLRLEGLPLDASIDELGALHVSISVDRWLDQARFDEASYALAWSLGIRDARAFVVTWDPEGGME